MFDQEKERAPFEEWYVKEFGLTECDKLDAAGRKCLKTLARDDDSGNLDGYVEAHAQLAWLGWLASRERLQPVVNYLTWYVFEDDVQEEDPDNEYWTEGRRRSLKSLEDIGLSQDEAYELYERIRT